MDPLIVSLLGVAFLLFRMWLCEYKLKDELEFRRHYLSRILSYYTALVIAFNFENLILNYIITSTVAVTVVSLIGWDAPFFKKFSSRTYWKKNHGWLIVERLTMHIPMLIVAIYLYMVGMPQIEWIDGIRLYMFTFPGFYLWYIRVDKRWSEKYIWPTGRDIMVFATVSLIGNAIYLVLQ
jgi:hypothetical protein